MEVVNLLYRSVCDTANIKTVHKIVSNFMSKLLPVLHCLICINAHPPLHLSHPQLKKVSLFGARKLETHNPRKWTCAQ